MFRETIEKELYVEPKGPGGRRPFDKIFMFKILVLQTIYNISYKEIEFQIIDRACFKRFLGINKKKMMYQVTRLYGALKKKLNKKKSIS